MKVYYYIPLEKSEVHDFSSGILNITDVNFNELFEFELKKESVAELVILASSRGSAIEITRAQYLEAVDEKLYLMAGGNPNRFHDGYFSASSERFSDMNDFKREFPHARLGEFDSDGEHYYSVSIQF